MYWFWYITVIPYGGTYIIYYLCILEVLNPHFQESFHISKAMSALTQAAVYGAYFLMALPAGWIIRKWGYRRGVITTTANITKIFKSEK